MVKHPHQTTANQRANATRANTPEQQTVRTRKGSGLGPFCPICKDHTLTGRECDNCRRHRYTLDVDQLAPVAALVCHDRNHPIRNDLHHYKTPGHSRQCLALGRLAALVAPALDTYRQLGALIVPVPSTRTPHHAPVADIIRAARHAPFPLLAATRPHPTRTADPHLFTTTVTAPSRPIVLVEDCYVTGSTAQAAAHTLTRAGAKALTVLTIGRRYR